MGERTTLTRATSKSDSLRTTVPKGIVRHFEMREKDRLDWTMKVNDSKLTIEVVHVKAGGGVPKASSAVRERKLAKKDNGMTRGENPRDRKRWRIK